jgi:hypothetical protein
MFLQPVESHNRKVFEIYFAVAVDVAGNNRFADWLAKIRFARFSCAAISTHIDNPAIGKWLKTNGTVWVTGINTGVRF